MICSRCIYDERNPYISFDDRGICNYCYQYDELDGEYPTGDEGMNRLRQLADKMRRDGRRKKYDVVVGVSGGTDSSYLVHLTKELELRPLAVHFDNTWNSKIAVENIQRVLKKLDVDLYTYVIDNHEYNDIFKSFFKASVPEIDTPADIALETVPYIAARKHGIKYIFQGFSFRTEGLSPHGWFYMDAKYVRSVQKLFGSCNFETYPNLWLLRWLKWCIVNKIRKIRPLYYVDYNKEETKKLLADTYGWQWYGGHHMENRTAYFTNNYYLPRKFNIDQRYCEFSALVRSGQMKRDEALDQIAQPFAFDEGILEEVKKRLGFSDEEFDQIMMLPRKTYRDYKTYKRTFERMKWVFWCMYKLDLVPKSFFLKYTKKYDDEVLIEERPFLSRPGEAVGGSQIMNPFHDTVGSPAMEQVRRTEEG